MPTSSGTVLGIIGTQWGDEGKGKIVDIYAKNVDTVVRFGGGANAGHTLVVGDQTYKLKLLPSGVVRGKHGVIGNGCVVDPFALIQEMTDLKSAGCPVRRLSISNRASLLLPWHQAIDQMGETGPTIPHIGTTGRGIGPCYADKINRIGLQMGDLLHPERLERKLWQHAESRIESFPTIASDPRFQPEHFLTGLLQAAQVLGPYITDTVELLHAALERGEMILLEGAQGSMLDIDHGSYPFVTSSNTTGGGMCTGTGLAPANIGSVIGVLKAYTTRVGNGPFPTEMETTAGIGKHLVEIGHEFGTNTGRRRRCGWLDLPIIRQAIRLSGITALAVTKLDILSGIGPIKVCKAYSLPNGTTLVRPPSDPDLLTEVKPIYAALPGWDNLGNGNKDALPEAVWRYLEFIEEQVGCPITLIGTGPERNEIINL